MRTTFNNTLLDTLVGQNEQLESFPSLRKSASTFLEEFGLPTLKEEEYKFTALSKRLEQTIQNFAPAASLELSSAEVEKHLFEDYAGDVLVFNNGDFDAGLSRLSSDYELNLISEKAPEKLGEIVKADPFASLNSLTFRDGIYLKVAKNKVVDRPVQFLFLNKSNAGEVISPRVFIEIEDNASIKFIENSISLDDAPYFVNAVIEISVGNNSHVHYNRLQNENRNVLKADNFTADVHRDSTFTSVVISLAADMVRNNLTLNLLDSGCEGNMYGLYLLNGKTHVDNHTNVDHTKPHSDSNELYKGILADKSRGVFNGKIFVRQDAQKTNAFQQNNNILLSEEAIVNTKPQLEIWADDVKCSHGCTTGQLDEEALFYLQTRGLNKEQARGMLLYAFSGEVVDYVFDEKFKNYLEKSVRERLGSSF